ncbi:hypothetical protein [Nocardia sp. NPDC019302]|uniref:hypothetical protein n=1 Tax=Nocardia sp. NPDC019302 TaxID=3154592 RepID=UPI00340CDA76
MAFQVGDRVQVKASPVSVFEVIEIEVDGDPGAVMIQAVDGTGRYPWHFRASDLIPAQT